MGGVSWQIVSETSFSYLQSEFVDRVRDDLSPQEGGAEGGHDSDNVNNWE